MLPLLLILAVFYQLSDVNGQLTIQPEQRNVCEYDAFISSREINGKVFLHPWNKNERQGDWYQARGYCAKHCAEMATIQSLEENQFFVAFFSEVNKNSLWLGAEVINVTEFTHWSNGDAATYHNKRSGEYNEPNHTCLNIYDLNQLAFYNDHCSNNFLIACQRNAYKMDIKNHKDHELNK